MLVGGRQLWGEWGVRSMLGWHLAVCVLGAGPHCPGPLFEAAPCTPLLL